MSTRVLVLNAQHYPIRVTSWKRAFTLWLKNRAEIVHEYEDKKLEFWGSAMNMPAVIRLYHFIKPPRKISWHLPFTRKNIWVRDGGRCQYCNCKVSKQEFTFDHVIPRNQGGRRHFTNIVCACHKCNSHKANRTPEEAEMKLIRKPFAPRLPEAKQRNINPNIRNLKYIPHRSWQSYIYWSVELEED